eukprot:10038725-Alexandrium_andersonii.AAC.1
MRGKGWQTEWVPRSMTVCSFFVKLWQAAVMLLAAGQRARARVKARNAAAIRDVPFKRWGTWTEAWLRPSRRDSDEQPAVDSP